mgnify:CR=1 FL=1
MERAMSRMVYRAHYSNTALYRMGITFDLGMEIEAVRIVVEGAARAMVVVECDRMKDAA